MLCPNCKKDVDSRNTYCTWCGTSLGARLCTNGHVMDPSWSECQTCTGRTGGAFAKGGTVLEGPPANDASAAGGFVRGATLLEGDHAGAKGRTVVDSGSQKGRTLVDGSAPKGHTVFDPRPADAASKGRTVFDSGRQANDYQGAVAPAPQTRARLVGWLVTFSHDTAGEDFRVSEGRNVIGSSPDDCDILVSEDATASSKHSVLMFRDGRFVIRDNDSQNGTYLNGQDIFGKESVVVGEGDIIRIGKTEFVLKVL